MTRKLAGAVLAAVAVLAVPGAAAWAQARPGDRQNVVPPAVVEQIAQARATGNAQVLADAVAAASNADPGLAAMIVALAVQGQGAADAGLIAAAAAAAVPSAAVQIAGAAAQADPAAAATIAAKVAAMAPTLASAIVVAVLSVMPADERMAAAPVIIAQVQGAVPNSTPTAAIVPLTPPQPVPPVAPPVAPNLLAQGPQLALPVPSVPSVSPH